MKITISQEGTSPISITIPDNINNKPEVKSQEGFITGVLVGMVLLPFVLFAMATVVLGISNVKNKAVFNKFSKHNQDIIIRITKILTEKLNDFLKFSKPLAIDAKNISDKVNSLSDIYEFKSATEKEIIDTMKTMTSQNQIIEILRSAKKNKGIQTFTTDEIDLVSTGIDWDKIYKMSDEELEKSNDGWGGYYDKAYKLTSKMLKELKNKYPIRRTDVYIAGDDFGGSGTIDLEFKMDLTELHELLKDIDVSNLKAVF